MSRQLEQKLEQRVAKEKAAALLSLYGGLTDSVARSGGELVGLAVRFRPADVLMTLKAVFPGGRMVAFVGSESLDGAFRKGMAEGNRDGLVWREDKYQGG